MQSLSTHLREAGDHGALSFHPACPVCRRERLVGALPPQRVVARATQALLASGVLALSTAAHGAVLAAEPDQEREGAPVPEQVATGDPSDSAAFDPGGESTELPLDDGVGPLAPAPQVPTDGDDGEAVEAEPLGDTAAPIVDLGDEPAAPSVPLQDSAPPAPPALLPGSPGEPPREAGPLVLTPGQEAPAATPVPAPSESLRPEVREPRETGRAKSREGGSPGSRPTTPSSAAPDPIEAPSATSAPVATTGISGAPDAGDRTYVVRTGDSLWSIASDFLGPRASAAAIAREVNRLWELNKKQIGTGDPDLLMVGTRLTLR